LLSAYGAKFALSFLILVWIHNLYALFQPVCKQPDVLWGALSHEVSLGVSERRW
jgi:hypothetical protein